MLRPTPGDPWGVEQHRWNTGAKENQQLNPGWPSNRQNSFMLDKRDDHDDNQDIRIELMQFVTNENVRRHCFRYVHISAWKLSASVFLPNVFHYCWFSTFSLLLVCKASFKDIHGISLPNRMCRERTDRPH